MDPSKRDSKREFDGSLDFDAEIMPSLTALPCFRPAPDREIDLTFAAYIESDARHLCEVWNAVAAPRRATLPAHVEPFYERSGFVPPIVNGLGFLALVRAAQRAGERFRDDLRPSVREAIAHDFPWMERRHEHVPEGWSPPYEFHPAFRRFIDVESVDDARARWQLSAAINEVQQQAYSHHAAQQFRLPELARHAERERELAINYLGHWQPRCTRALFRQCVFVLDGLNAAIFGMICMERPFRLFGRATLAALTERSQWARFRSGLERPQWLLPVNPPDDVSSHSSPL